MWPKEEVTEAQQFCCLLDTSPTTRRRGVAWTFALDPNLRLTEPDLAAAVPSGDPVEPPSDKRLLIGATTSVGIWASGQVGGHVFLPAVGGRVPRYKTASGIRVAGPEEVDAPEVAVSSSPFVALLADASDDPHRARFP